MLILIIVCFGANEGVGFYYGQCDEDDSNFLSCLIDELANEDGEDEPAEGTVAATGTYEYKGYDVTITANIPLKGGAVTGTVSGTCEGQVKGTYNGQQGGAFTGKLSGVCAPFFVNIPAGADFSGSVNKTGKTAPISFNGGGGGFKHEGSMTLSYK
jgi:hypothetical protein